MNENIAFKLFASCLPVKGAFRSLICDTQRNFFHFIPNGLFEILKNYNGCTIQKVKAIYENKYDETIDDYFNFLKENEYIFFTKNPDYFPELDLRWDEPNRISNAIIDLDAESKFNWSFINTQLEELGCRFIQIRCFDILSGELLTNLLLSFEGSSIENIEILIKFDSILDESFLISYVDEFPRVSKLIVYAAPENKIAYLSPYKMGNILFIKNINLNQKHCGIFSKEKFVNNIKHFTEAQHHNTCLNRKISIDTQGNIKNCPSMQKSYGNIKDTTLMEALQHPDFKQLWNINKDEIHVCKDCEFRYICTDCRAYIEDPEDIYSKPLKCGYNPYTGEWSEWSTNPLKQKAIEYYGMEELVKEG